MLSEGDIVPNLALHLDENARVGLHDLRGRAVVLYFYPKDDTAGCTAEAHDFSTLAGDFADAGAEVIGVSPDKPATHQRFRQKYALRHKLASDTDKVLAGAFGVWVEKSMYGRKYMGVERATFLIDRDGRVARCWRKVKVPGHASAVLDAVRDVTA